MIYSRPRAYSLLPYEERMKLMAARAKAIIIGGRCGLAIL